MQFNQLKNCDFIMLCGGAAAGLRACTQHPESHWFPANDPTIQEREP
jgi:hypothetical protein